MNTNYLRSWVWAVWILGWHSHWDTTNPWSCELERELYSSTCSLMWQDAVIMEPTPPLVCCPFIHHRISVETKPIGKERESMVGGQLDLCWLWWPSHPLQCPPDKTDNLWVTTMTFIVLWSDSTAGFMLVDNSSFIGHCNLTELEVSYCSIKMLSYNAQVKQQHSILTHLHT